MQTKKVLPFQSDTRPATTTVDQRLQYVAASHAQASQSAMHAYIKRLCQLLPYDSSTKQRWEVFQVSRVLIKNIERSFDLDNPRDIQDFFVLLLRQRAQDAEIKMNIEMLAADMLRDEQRKLKYLRQWWKQLDKQEQQELQEQKVTDND